MIDRLAEDLETATRARLADKLSTVAKAPSNLMARLAMDDSIEVARRVLTHSDRLDNKTLVSIAQSKSQNHLLAM